MQLQPQLPVQREAPGRARFGAHVLCRPGAVRQGREQAWVQLPVQQVALLCWGTARMQAP